MCPYGRSGVFSLHWAIRRIGRAAPVSGLRAAGANPLTGHHFASNHGIRFQLSTRSDRLRPTSGAGELAGPRARRGAVRAQLRGRRRELRAARRPRLRAVPVRDRRRGRVSGAPHEHGVDLRIRLARGRVAHPARVRQARAAAHGVRRRHGDRAASGARARVRRARPRDRVSRLALDSLSGHDARARSRAHAARNGGDRARDGRAPARLVYGPRQSEHASARRRVRRLPVRLRSLRRRSAVLDGRRGVGRRERAATDRPVHARRERHAFRDAAGLQHRRSFLPLSARRVRRAVRGRRRSAQDDVDRHALPPARPAGALSRAAALSRSHRAARSRVGRAPRRDRAALARASSVSAARPARGDA
ncbi:hypothetical protein NCM_03687 [Burkholderia pseudomallei]